MRHRTPLVSGKLNSTLRAGTVHFLLKIFHTEQRNCLKSHDDARMTPEVVVCELNIRKSAAVSFRLICILRKRQ